MHFTVLLLRLLDADAKCDVPIHVVSLSGYKVQVSKSNVKPK